MKHVMWAIPALVALTAAPVFAQGWTTDQSAKQVVDDKQAAEATVAMKQQAASTAKLAEKFKVELDQQLKVSVVGRVIKGAPYSADTVNESVQTLADGNRIVSRTTTKVYRDGEGRTRTERVEESGTQVVSITDGTAGTTYMLYPQTQTAVQGEAIFVNYVKTAQGDVGFATTATIDKTVAEKKAMVEFTYVTRTDGVAVQGIAHEGAVSSKQATREDLGEQMIEGVMATGTRTTTVIPAGAIGNEQPIRVVSEEWYCKDLGILVLTKYSDPRSGETTYRVTNINRVDPDPSLFQVPGDYKVQLSKIKRDGQ